METKPNSSHTFNSKDLQNLQQELEESKSELERVKQEQEQTSLQIQQHREEMDRRALLMLHMDEGLMDGLMKLDTVKREKQELEKQLHQLTTRSTKLPAVSLSELQKEEAALLEEEKDLKLQCGKLKKALEDERKKAQR